MRNKEYKSQQYQKAYERHLGVCVECGCRASQIAHRIPQRKWLIKKYGFEVINHHLNLYPACCLRCNALLQARQWEWDDLAEEIKKEIEKERQL